jgi:hypothetical protein
MSSSAYFQQVIKCFTPNQFLHRCTAAGLAHLTQKATYVNSSSSPLTAAFNSKPRKLNLNFSLTTENTVKLLSEITLCLFFIVRV